MTLSYSELLLAFAVAALVVLVLFLVRKRWVLHPKGLQTVARKSDVAGEEENYTKYLVPLMLYEEKYPSFGKILTLVSAHFPLAQFLREEQFKSALTFLCDSAFQSFGGRRIVPAMAVMVRTLVEDPDVEYRCRAQLHGLIKEFLKEIERS